MGIVDSKKKIAVAKGAQKVVQHAKLVAKRAKKIAKVVKKQTKKVKKTAKKVVKKAKVAKKVTVTKVAKAMHKLEDAIEVVKKVKIGITHAKKIEKAKKKAKKVSKKARVALKKAIKAKKGVKKAKAAVKRAKAVVKKVIVKAKSVFKKVGKQVKAHAHLMKIKVHVRPKDCKCTPKKAIHKVGKPLVFKKKVVKKPKMKIAIHHKTGTTCGSGPPQYQAACYRARHQKVPKFALDAEKKAKIAIKKPVVKAKIGIKKPVVKGKIAIKKPVLKKPKMKIAIHKPHMTGTSCGSRPPQYQAACYRSRHQKIPKFALDAEKKAKGKIAIKKPV